MLMQNEDNNQPEAGWVFTPGSKAAPAPQSATNSAPRTQTAVPHNSQVSWTASEYIANPKNVKWFALLAVATLVLTVIIYLFTRDIISVVVILMLGIIVGVFAARQPNVLEYHLDTSGLYMGQKFYPYTSFKSFSVVEDGAFSHLSLMPLKRFMPSLAVHYAPEDEENIINTLSDYLPYEKHKRDVVENITRRVRF